jgi:ketosteroid isomerase-like protein
MRGLKWVAFLAFAGASVVHAQKDADADAQSKIVAMEHVWAQAYRAKDPKAVSRILDDAFVGVGSDGKLVTKEEVLEEVKTSNVLQVVVDSMVVHLHGDTAIITGLFRTTGVDHGKAYVRRERFVDTWLYRNGQWTTISSIVTLTRD